MVFGYSQVVCSKLPHNPEESIEEDDFGEWEHLVLPFPDNEKVFGMRVFKNDKLTPHEAWLVGGRGTQPIVVSGEVMYTVKSIHECKHGVTVSVVDHKTGVTCETFESWDHLSFEDRQVARKRENNPRFYGTNGEEITKEYVQKKNREIIDKEMRDARVHRPPFMSVEQIMKSCNVDEAKAKQLHDLAFNELDVSPAAIERRRRNFWKQFHKLSTDTINKILDKIIEAQKNDIGS